MDSNFLNQHRYKQTVYRKAIARWKWLLFLKAVSSGSNSGCGVAFRRVPGDADAAFPGAVAGGAGRLDRPPAGDHEPADPQAASLRHHQRPGRHQPHREAVGQQSQVDVSEQMNR